MNELNLFDYSGEEVLKSYQNVYDKEQVLAYFNGEKIIFRENCKDVPVRTDLSGKFESQYSYDFTSVWVKDGYYGHYVSKDCLKFLNLEDFKKKFPYSGIDKINDCISADDWRYRCRSSNFRTIAYATLYCEHPEIELLYKVGATRLVDDWAADAIKGRDTSKYTRAFKKGKNMDEITNLPKYAWSRLLDNCKTSINDWNEFRIWVKKENLSADAMDEIFNQRLSGTELNKLRKLVSREFNGKKIYTLEGLLNYLHRCDVYQAIPQYEAIDLLEDYIRMCVKLGVEPQKTTNSLKREHDVTARNYGIWAQQQRFEKEKDGFALNSKRLQKYEWAEGDYVVTTPREISDLINEGINNCNCVGSYVDIYAAGKSNIFFIRKAKTPEKSYITIELNSTLTNYKQAFLCSNQRITNPADWTFINNWLEYCKEVK